MTCFVFSLASHSLVAHVHTESLDLHYYYFLSFLSSPLSPPLSEAGPKVPRCRATGDRVLVLGMERACL